MTTTEPLLRSSWEGLPGNIWIGEEEEEVENSIETMRSRLQEMALALQTKDSALLDLRRQVQAAMEEAERSKAREAALQRRVDIAEAAEEALASEMGQLEAEAYASITEKKLLLSVGQKGLDSLWMKETEKRTEVAGQDAACWESRCRELAAEMAEGRAREAMLLKRLQNAEAAEEALASQMADLEAEAYSHITGHSSVSDVTKQGQDRQAEVVEAGERCQLAELKRRLAEAELALQAAEAKVRLAEEGDRWREKEDGKKVTVTRKGEGAQMALSLSLQELSGMVKLRLWSPSFLSLTSA